MADDPTLPRRTKKPLLPRWLKFLLILVGTFFFLAASAWVLLDIVTRQDLEAAIEDMRRLGAPRRLEEVYPDPHLVADNAAFLYEQAFSRLDAPGSVVEYSWLADEPGGLSEEERAELLSILERNAEALALIRQAVKKQSCCFDLSGWPLHHALHPYEENLTYITEMFSLELMSTIAEGDIDDAFNLWVDWAGVCRHEVGQTVVLWQGERLYGISHMLCGLEDLIQTGRLTREQLIRAREAIHGLEAHREFIEGLKSDVFAPEVLLAQPRDDVIHDLTGFTRGVPPRRERVFVWLYTSWLARPLRHYDQAKYLALLAENIRLCQRPFHVVTKQFEEWETERDRLDSGVTPHDRMAWMTPLSRELTDWRLPDASDLACVDADLAGARTGLALELYRLRNGAYPRGLEELCPDFLTGVPVDPFDGQPMRYLNAEGRLVVYSVNLNLVADHGSTEWKDGEGVKDLVFTVRPSSNQPSEE